MLTVQELEKEIARLTREDLTRLRVWFDEFDAQRWDEQFEEDAKSGKLAQLSQKAVKEFESGNYHEL
jgi:hypothetical protein